MTIHVAFDKSDLPAWARRDPLVVELCRRDLAFRCDVADATRSDTKRFLRREAARRATMRAICK